jgi:hypothetical protein
MFPQLARFTDLGLFLLRLMVGLVFVNSGYSHLKNPAARAKSIQMPKPFTIFLGIAEVDFRLAHRLLGRESLWLALRPDVYPDEPGHRLHQRRSLRADAITLSNPFPFSKRTSRQSHRTRFGAFLLLSASLT